jgi:hypothetical protein
MISTLSQYHDETKTIHLGEYDSVNQLFMDTYVPTICVVDNVTMYVAYQEVIRMHPHLIVAMCICGCDVQDVHSVVGSRDVYYMSRRYIAFDIRTPLHMNVCGLTTTFVLHVTHTDHIRYMIDTFRYLFGVFHKTTGNVLHVILAIHDHVDNHMVGQLMDSCKKNASLSVRWHTHVSSHVDHPSSKDWHFRWKSTRTMFPPSLLGDLYVTHSNADDDISMVMASCSEPETLPCMVRLNFDGGTTHVSTTVVVE